jgi:MarR family transcriptional regulator, organic hydroperoxide resistance regulator
MMTADVYDHLDQLSNLLDASSRELASRHGLKRVQLRVLHYLARANRYSNTPKGVAAYFGLTKGTVSQTLRALQRKNLVRREADSADGRVVRLFLTDAGRAVAGSTYPVRWVASVDPGLGPPLAELVRELQRTRGGRSFGECRTCRRHRQLGAAEAVCGLTGERLSAEDAAGICLEHAA